ncbi:probable UDP-3-O-acyl-N-acetylglucosamine deacetylase 1, mitochondrial isoform X2 [Spinacia oleracea]|uniref:UDP-3-O-acyl-N-acetylglucosamine deacetylase n=1 Tax=Spinacia oleracea TaxID=3562 RepID=A0A9R0I5J8_SPIOL|nr:probable UDP-3-O-acyl-N-acetylglucosamine deacetylase 1, mitochondrial isoform X2 [Spinacia oleracea]
MSFNVLKSSAAAVSWKSTGNLQKTLARCIEKHGVGLHSGRPTKIKIWPELAKKGRYFQVGSNVIESSINFVKESPLCTTLCKDGVMVTTVEHLLSALEAFGVDNCRIEITPSNPNEPGVEVPILDGSAREWVKAIEEAGLEDATDENAFPSEEIHITCGINFPEVPSIGCQWFFSRNFNRSFYATDIASARTFCVYEEVEKIREMGLIKGGSLDNAIVCSASKGWLNSALRFHDEPCRHKVLDLIGDLSIFAKSGNQGLPVAHIVAYKAGHALHTDLVRHLT